MTNFLQNSTDYLCKKRMRHVFIRHHLYRQKNFDFLTAFLKKIQKAHTAILQPYAPIYLSPIFDFGLGNDTYAVESLLRLYCTTFRGSCQYFQ